VRCAICAAPPQSSGWLALLVCWLESVSRHTEKPEEAAANTRTQTRAVFSSFGSARAPSGRLCSSAEAALCWLDAPNWPNCPPLPSDNYDGEPDDDADDEADVEADA